MRRRRTWFLVVAGFALQAIAFFLLGADLGVPTSPANSNPTVEFAPVVFILGVALVFLAAVEYEIFHEDRPSQANDRQ